MDGTIDGRQASHVSAGEGVLGRAAFAGQLPGRLMFHGLAYWLSSLRFEGRTLHVEVTAWRHMLDELGKQSPVLRIWSRRADGRRHEFAVAHRAEEREITRLAFVVPIDTLASDAGRMETFSTSLRVGTERPGLPCLTWLEECRYRIGNLDLLPYSTAAGNLALTLVRRRLAASTARPGGLRGIVFVMREGASGGKTRAMFSLAQAFASAGADMTVTSLQLSRSGPVFPLPQAVDFDYADASQFAARHEGPFKWDGLHWLASPRARARVASYLQKVDADFVYLPNYDCDLYAFFCKHLPPGVVRVLGDHRASRYAKVFAEDRLPDAPYNDLFKRAMAQFDAVHVLLEPVARVYGAVTRSPLVCIPNPIDVVRTLEPARFLDRRRIIVIARLTEVKQVDHSIRAFHAAGGAQRGWSLDVFGVGELEEPLRALVTELGLTGSVQLRGFDGDMQTRLAESAIHLSSSRFESFGLTLLEAMNAGVPVIAYGGHPGSMTLIGDSERGIVVPPGDIGALGAALGRVMDQVEARDPDLRSLVQRAFDFSQTFSHDAVGRRWMEAIERLVEQKRVTLAAPQPNGATRS